MVEFLFLCRFVDLSCDSVHKTANGKKDLNQYFFTMDHYGLNKLLQ